MDRGIVKQAATRKMFRVDALYRVVAGIGMNVEQKNYMTYDIVDCLSRNALIIIIESRAHATCKKKKKNKNDFWKSRIVFERKRRTIADMRRIYFSPPSFTHIRQRFLLQISFSAQMKRFRRQN